MISLHPNPSTLFLLLLVLLFTSTLSLNHESLDNIGGHENSKNGDMNGVSENERKEGLSCDFAVHLREGYDPLSFAVELGLEYIKPIGSLENHYLFRALDHEHACSVHDRLSRGIKDKRDTETRELKDTESHTINYESTNTAVDNTEIGENCVHWFERQVYRQRYSRSRIPDIDDAMHNMPLLPTRNTRSQTIEDYPPSNSIWMPSDPLFKDQWNLHNTGQLQSSGGIDMNIVPAWQLASGLGIRVAIVDDGIQHNHKDLIERYSADTSYNFNDNNKNILPQKPDTHGTMCAGATAASANGVCGVGVAFQAFISGLRILGGPSSDAMEADALSHMYHLNHIFSNSWGPTDDGRTLEGPGPLTRKAIERGIKLGRNGLGSIYVWAAGNGAKKGDNCNYDGYASSRYVLTVGSVDYLGHRPFYSELCSAILISAPSSGKGMDGIVTDNIELGCTSKFTGTSAAAPLVAGVVALLLEVNPNLTWRDVHHILVNSAQLNDMEDPDWIENGASRYVNHKYGYGIVDAHAAVILAKQWTNVAEEISLESLLTVVNMRIPDNSDEGIKSTIQIEKNIILERAEVVFSAKHAVRTDLRVVLISPSGTPSYLSEMHGESPTYVLKLIYETNETFSVPSISAGFGPTPMSWLEQYVTASLILTEPASACSPITNDIRGSVAAITADDKCSYTTKVKHAQDAGAKAVLVINTKSKAQEMAGYDSSIVIPALMIGEKDAVRVMDTIPDQKVNTQLTTSITMKGNLPHFDNWVFTTVHVWDEESAGTWTLQVYDKHATGTGEFNSWKLKLYGTPFHNTTKYNHYLSGSSPRVSDSSPVSSSFSFSPQKLSHYFRGYYLILLVMIVALTALVIFGWHRINRDDKINTAAQQAGV